LRHQIAAGTLRRRSEGLIEAARESGSVTAEEIALALADLDLMREMDELAAAEQAGDRARRRRGGGRCRRVRVRGADLLRSFWGISGGFNF
jgi:hypothetical protein